MEEKEETYPVELFEECSKAQIKDLTSKLDLLKDETLFKIPEYKNYYYGGMKYLHNLVSRLKVDDRKVFWENLNITDFVTNMNNVNNLSKILSRSLFSLDCDVEVVHLIIKDYFKRIINRINNKR